MRKQKTILNITRLNHGCSYHTVELAWPAGQQRRPYSTSLLCKTIYRCSPRNKYWEQPNINFRNYSFYNCPGTENNGIYHGGSALVVDKATPHTLITLRTNLQATAVRATVFKTITVCSVYLPPSQKWDIKDLGGLVSTTPLPSTCAWGFQCT